MLIVFCCSRSVTRLPASDSAVTVSTAFVLELFMWLRGALSHSESMGMLISLCKFLQLCETGIWRNGGALAWQSHSISFVSIAQLPKRLYSYLIRILGWQKIIKINFHLFTHSHFNSHHFIHYLFYILRWFWSSETFFCLFQHII